VPSGTPARRTKQDAAAAIGLAPMGAGDAQDTLAREAEERAITSAQAAAEGITLPGYAQLRGRRFLFGPAQAMAPVLDFGKAAAEGLDSDDPAGMAAIRDMLRASFIVTFSCGSCEACIEDRFDECPALDEGEWPAFWRFAAAVGATGDELMEVVTQASEHATARPTPAPSGSSPPAPTTSRKSKARSSSGGRVPAEFAALQPGDLIDVRDVLR
jgi:hypothetical protein